MMVPMALLMTSLFSACQMMALVLYPSIAEATGLPLAGVISSFSLGSCLFLWGSPYWTRRCETRGARGVLAWGLGGLLLSQLVLLLFLARPGQREWNGWILGSSRILYGLTASAILPVSQMIMAASSSDQGRMRAMTRQSLALHAGRLVGPLLVGLGLMGSPHAPLAWSVLLLLALGLWLPFLPPSRMPRQEHSVKKLLWPTSASTHRLLLLALGVTTLVGLLQAGLTRQMQLELGLSAYAAARLTLRFLIASSSVTLGVQLLVQARVKNPWQGTFPLGALCLTLGSGCLARFRTEQELWWALPLFAAGLAFLTPSYTTALSLEEPQSRAAALLSVTHTLGYAAGGLLTAGLTAWGCPPLQAAPGIALFLGILVLFLKPGTESSLQPVTRKNR